MRFRILQNAGLQNEMGFSGHGIVLFLRKSGRCVIIEGR